MFNNGASLVTANKVQEAWQNNNSQQKDKTYLIESEVFWNKALKVAKINYKTEKVNLTALGINNLNELKTFSAVCLPDFEITVNDNKIDNPNYFALFIPTSDLKVLTNEFDWVMLDNKNDFRTTINKEWYSVYFYMKGVVWMDINTAILYLKLFYSFEITEESPSSSNYINLRIKSGSTLQVIRK